MSATSDPYDRIATYYDCEHESFREDIDLYLSQIERGPVLEIGTGTGRVAAALAASGIDVVGIDPSRAMLKRANSRVRGLERVRLLEGTIADVPADTRFAAVVLTLNVLWHVATQRDQLILLRDARDRIIPDGRLYLDLSNPLNLADAGAGGLKRTRFTGECEGCRLEVTSAAWDDRPNQLLSLAFAYDLIPDDGLVRRTTTGLVLRYTYRAELELMVRDAGFRVDGVYGGYDLEVYGEDSPNLLLTATAE